MSRIGMLILVIAISAGIAILPLLVDPAQPADPYYGVKAWALWALLPLLAVGSALSARDPAVRRRVPWAPLLAFLLAVVAATIFGVDLRWSVWGAPWRHEGALSLIAYALICAGTAAGFARGGRRLWLTAVLAGAVLTAMGGILQFLGWTWLPLDVQRARWHQAFFTTGNPNWLGAYMILAAPLAIATAQTAKSRAGRMLGLVGFGLIVLAALMTFSRVAWFVLALTLAAYGWLSRSHDASRSRSTMVAGALAGVVLVGFLSVGGVRSAVWARTQEIAGRSGPVQQRLYLWRETMSLVIRRPLLGYGPEAFPRVFPQQWTEHRRRLFGDEPLVMDKAHNDTLDLTVSIGIVGVAAFWWLVAMCLRRAWWMARTPGPGQALATACLAAAVGYLLCLQFNFSVVSVAPVFWSVLGMAALIPPRRPPFHGRQLLGKRAMAAQRPPWPG